MKSLAVLVAVIGLSAAAQTLPEKFYGKWDLDHSENFDEYLEAKGYSWFTRKLVTLATFKKEFKPAKTAGRFDYANLTSKKDVFYNDVLLGQKFVGEGLDSTKHEVTFEVKNDVLYEKHHPIETGEAVDEVYEYTAYTDNDGTWLLVKMEANGVVGKRFYKKM